MKTIGIICEYNPFHLGHKKQIDLIRQEFGEDCRIVCLMSGNFVQRGHPAIFHKSLRAEAALRCGADLVLELPIPCCLSSAEGFAAGGVEILSGFCDYLCFGAESGTEKELMDTAKLLLSDQFSGTLREQLATGISFPAARQIALKKMGGNADLLENPNDILAVEYCKAIIAQSSSMKPFPILRMGNYHDTVADDENPSATSLRKLLIEKEQWSHYVPASLLPLYDNATVHTISAGERGILYRLRTMTDEEFQSLPYGSEGLWRRLMHACRSCTTLEEILNSVKTKRYTRTRLDRMIMCAFLGLSELKRPEYTRVLGFNSNGIPLLKQARKTGVFVHAGEEMKSDYQALEHRCNGLYALLCEEEIEPPQKEERMVILP